jgi:transcriptional regulator with XRE-family HTH domain/GTPase SAR1 family protein
MADDSSFGLMLKARRRAADLTQERLAEQASCSVETIKKIEAGKLRPSRHLAEILADRLGVPPEAREAFLSAARTVPSPRPGAPSGQSILAQPVVPVVADPLPATAPGAQRQPHDRHRRRMLGKVRQFWIDGVLQHSLQGAARITLALVYRPDLVAPPWELPIYNAAQPARPIPIGTSISSIFDDLGAEVLILGAPGAGKTTLLLELAHSLLERAEHDPTQPIPVVLNLASWARQRGLIADWIAAEIHARYAIPRPVSREWIAAANIVALLDGLDEIQAPYRSACVVALNRYRQDYGSGGMIVCGRQSAYEPLTTRLHLHGAVIVQPLNWSQIDAYLKQTGSNTVALREALQTEITLRALIENPLMLRVATLAYQDQVTHQRPLPTVERDWPSRLFAAYVERMVQPRGERMRYTRQQLLGGLTWLARCLQAQGQPVFTCDQLQPNWLPAMGMRRQYQLLSLLSGAAMFGLLGALLGAWYLGASTGVLLGLIINRFGWLPVGRVSLLVGLVCALSGGLNGGLSMGIIIGLAGVSLSFLACQIYPQVNRLLLRFVLARGGVFPWAQTQFLDECTERMLLQRVGTGYMFVHHLLLDYMAELKP